MKIAIAACLGVGAVALTACIPPHARHWGARLKPIARLDCPQAMGGLKLATADADRKSCVYSGADGSEVQLMLLPVSGDPSTVLAPIEAELKTQLPAPPPPASSAPASAAPAQDGRDRNVDIQLPGISIQADNDRTKVNVGPVHIDADGDNDKVHVGGRASPLSGKQFTVDANNAGAIVRTRGRGPDVDVSLVLTTAAPGPQGWKLVGYDARGPKTGPLVVATVKSRSDDVNEAMSDAHRLVRRSAEG